MSSADHSQMNTQPNGYNITITDCNSITKAEITLRRGSLNIKYGPNGIGKSTIARALELNAKGDDGLQELLPFKYSQCDNGPVPAVVGADEIKNVLVFDEKYVSQFVFQPDEVVKNSFEIFVNTPEYQSRKENLEAIFEELKKLFREDKELDEVIDSFTELCEAFTITKSGSIAKTSKGFKALTGGKFDVIPPALKGFKEFLKSNDPAGWLSWQAKGKGFLELSENCPFCSIPKVNKEAASGVSKEYESPSVKNMAALRLAIDKLERFFEPEHLEELRRITRSLEDLSPDEEQFLVTLRDQVETLLDKFTARKELSSESFPGVADVDKVLHGLKIELRLLNTLDSEETQRVVREMNEELDCVAQQINEIKEHVGIQKSQVAKSIRQNQDEVNEYLRSAGYKYEVRIESSGDSYRMIVEHQDTPGHLQRAGTHLSFGERNAFALVLFMHQVRREKPDLVVLDDPVSSFDKTKKFAILHKLFHGDQSLQGFTTLLLTHDIEPAIDIFKTGYLDETKLAVHFLRSREGQVEEKPIQEEDIKTFAQVCKEIIESSADPIIKSIYLRRLYYLHNNRGTKYDVLSSLIHLRHEPSSKGKNRALTPLGCEEREQAIAEIQRTIPSFDYVQLLAQLKDFEALKAKFEATEVGYDKVQIFRFASKIDPTLKKLDPTLMKFVNESYHIENEYVMQLNPREFDAVPEHFVQACAELLGVAPNLSGMTLGGGDQVKVN